MPAIWDLTALVNAVDARAPQAERHLWLVRLMEWLRHAPTTRAAGENAETGTSGETRTPLPLLRLRHLLNVIEQHPDVRAQIQGLLAGFWKEIDAAALFADFGFGARLSLRSEVAARLRRRLLPGTPETSDLAELFGLLFQPEDGEWLRALDEATLARVSALLATPEAAWRDAMAEALTILVSAVHASGYAPALRQRMDRSLLAHQPFRQLTMSTNALRRALADGAPPEELQQQARMLRALLDECRDAAASVRAHLETYGVSVDILFEVDQLHARLRRIELLLDVLLAPQPQPELLRLLQALVQVAGRQRGIRSMLSRQYALLARLLAERHAEVGSHYITRDRSEFLAMLRMALGGGAVMAFTTLLKFGILALGLSAFWGGVGAGLNYATSFVIIMLAHWTVATKQPAMTAPAMADCLPRGRDNDAEVLEGFVDRVAQLTRSQTAGILGNVMACGPLVFALQWLCTIVFGQPLVGAESGHHVLESLHLLGPTLFFAAFTGVLLYGSSMMAGWAENWFVFHRLDSAIAWNPRIVGRLGRARAQRWATWWRDNVSGVVANASLGFMLGMVPPLAAFLGLPLDVRHVTLSSGQLGAALGSLGTEALLAPAFWWCLAAIPLTGLLNVSVSFFLAFRLALRARGIELHERARIRAAIRARLRRAPLSFLLPPRR
ncbi:MAG TPA: site-specific recombinase [Rubrivivax sp.]|nr:site-specific recombinase [Burkholderiales bacterium]HNT40231.1 site-specific recombinase [Rubrivivax sp.]